MESGSRGPEDQKNAKPDERREDAPRREREDAPGEKRADAPGEKRADAPGEKRADAPRESRADAQSAREREATPAPDEAPRRRAEPPVPAATEELLRGTPASFEMEFKGGRKAICENPRNIPFRAGDHAIVEVDRGQDIGVIVREGAEASKKLRDKGVQGPILRRATAADISHQGELREKEAEAHRICQQCIARQSLPMKLVDVEWQFDGNKIRFYFTSDRRVDFRKLVRDLASIFKTRIEMRQIGVRDEARRLGGFGRCGRYYCCRGVISDFDPVTLKMVKEQHLAPGSPKISGGCGRLMCCLRYERGLYAQAKKDFPKLGTKVTIEGETLKVINADIFRRTVTLGRKDADPVTVALEDFKKGKITAVGTEEAGEVQEDYWGEAERIVGDDE